MQTLVDFHPVWREWIESRFANGITVAGVELEPSREELRAWIDTQPEESLYAVIQAAMDCLDLLYAPEGEKKRESRARLEELRIELRAERISYGELIELQNLREYIDPGDVELLEAAGVEEFPADNPETRLATLQRMHDECDNRVTRQTITDAIELIRNGVLPSTAEDTVGNLRRDRTRLALQLIAETFGDA